MSAELIPKNADLRRFVEAVLPTDDDLTAYCLDHFREVAKHFSSGMTRTAKINLLVSSVGPREILAAFKQYAPEQYERHAALLSIPSWTSKNPYRGLSAFQVGEAHLFFGRAALTEKLHTRFKTLRDAPDAVRLLTILGPSGSGKSSVARAGLLAALAQSQVPGSQPLRLAIVKPGERPFESLARELVPLLPADSSVLPASRQVAIEKLFRDKEIPAQGLRRFAADLSDIAASPLCVCIDQFEEVYTLCKEPEERDIFVKTLLHAASDSSRSVAIVLTLRSDFLGETQRQHPELNRIIAAQHELVPAMSAEELRDAIAKPAAQAVRPIDEATVELLLTEARGSQGALPLLEFALTRIWEGMQAGKGPGRTLIEIGGVGGALAGEAQKIYQALTPSEQATARRALVRLVRLGEGTRDTRRRAPLSELCGRGETSNTVLSVLRKFATENARLVTLSGDGAETVAEVTHEALFDHWAELRTWIEQSRKDRGLYDRALEAAKLWNQDGRPAGRLWRPPDLDLVRDYQKRKPEDFGPLAAEFLVAAERRQRTEWALSMGAVAAVVAALLIAAGVYVAKERQRTRESSAAKESIRQQLLDSYVERGSQLLFENGKSSEGLLWLHRAQGERSLNPALPDLLKSAMRSADATKAVLIGHGDSVLSAMFSPDGRRIVTASGDHTARVWEADGGRLVAELKGHGDIVLSATYSPDGRRIVTASGDHTARVWEADGGRLLTELKGHGDSVVSAKFSPDGRRIVTASSDQTARVWEADGGRLVAELKGHGDIVRSARFSPDGRRIVTASGDNTARVWEVDGGRLIAELNGHGGYVLSATYSPDGRHVVTASGDKTARVWEADSGRLVAELKGHGAFVWSATYSPDGRRIVTASYDQTARMWEADSGRLVAELKGHGAFVRSATYSPDGRRIVTASEDKTARVWEADSGRLVAELKGHGDSVRSVTYSPDGRRIVTASGDQTARVWEADGGQLVVELKGHLDVVNSATYSPDGRRIVTASNDNTARVWEAEGGRLAAELKGHGDSVRSARFSPDGRRIVTASLDNAARVWEVDSGGLIAELKGHGDSVLSAMFSPDGRRIVTASSDKTARVWEAQGGRLVAELKGHGASVLSATYSPDGRRIVTASEDKTARVWDAADGRLLAELKGHGDSIRSVTYSPDGRRIVTASDDHRARVWDAADGRLVAELKGHGDSVWSATYSPDGRRIVTASEDHIARVWDLSPETRTYEQIAKLIRCNVPAQFEREDSNVIIFRMPTPAECQNDQSPAPAALLPVQH